VPPPAEAPVAERKLVSILFADLVGFTASSEKRDAEDTRDLLSRYFDTCRRLIELYGGTVEKFIGDASWPSGARRRDRRRRRARRSGRARPRRGGERARRVSSGCRPACPRGVMTGEAAVTIGAEGEGMVAGDLVNTASRVQGLAEPGTVLVGEAPAARRSRRSPTRTPAATS
jgi:Adenylate cyclase, family 3 (some proteins contain HAMP domain)